MSIYQNTNGNSWVFNDSSLYPGVQWGMSTPVDDWYGVVVSGGHVTELNLYRSGVQGNFRIDQGNLNFMIFLDIGGNQITSFDGNNLA